MHVRPDSNATTELGAGQGKADVRKAAGADRIRVAAVAVRKAVVDRKVEDVRKVHVRSDPHRADRMVKADLLAQKADRMAKDVRPVAKVVRKVKAAIVLRSAMEAARKAKVVRPVQREDRIKVAAKAVRKEKDVRPNAVHVHKAEVVHHKAEVVHPKAEVVHHNVVVVRKAEADRKVAADRMVQNNAAIAHPVRRLRNVHRSTTIHGNQ